MTSKKNLENSLTSHRTNYTAPEYFCFFSLLFSFFSSCVWFFFCRCWLKRAEVLFTAEYVEQLKPEVVSDGRGEEQVRAAQRPTQPTPCTTTLNEVTIANGFLHRPQCSRGSARRSSTSSSRSRKKPDTKTNTCRNGERPGDCGLWKHKSGCRQFGRLLDRHASGWVRVVCVWASVVVDVDEPR